MPSDDGIDKTRNEIESGMALTKCRPCGCMRDALTSLSSAVATIEKPEVQVFAAEVTAWLQQLEPLKYACLGCEYCYAAVGQGAFFAAFPNAAQAPLACDFQPRADQWPSVAGEYLVLDRQGHIAVSTLGSDSLSGELAQRHPHGLAIVGKTETENIGIDKIIKNIVTNRAIQYLVVAGNDPAGHRSGQTLVALAKNGADENGRVIGSPGKRPVLRNVSQAEIEAFRGQVQLIDLIGCEDATQIAAQVEALRPKATAPCG